MRKTVLGEFIKRLFIVLTACVVMGTAPLTAGAADSAWPAVIRPGVQAGTGTADYSIELFSPLYQTNSSMLFLAPRFRANPGLNDENEVNVGLGYRKLIANDSWFVGGNVFFDTIKSPNDNRFNQIGLGIEARSRSIDAILNGYIVVGRDIKRAEGLDSFSRVSRTIFRANGAEQALSGLDGEVGVLIPYVSDFVETRAYLGGYWFFSDISEDITGVKARVQINPVPLVTINGIYTWDDKFQSAWRGDAYLNVPFSVTNLFQGKNPFEGIRDALKFAKGPSGARARMTDRVERDRYIRTVAGNPTPPVPLSNFSLK